MQYSNYNWIDENIAIGDRNSDYSNFNIIVNLDFDNNGVDYHSIDMQCVKGKHIYRVGCLDSEVEDMENLVKTVIPEIVIYYNNNRELKILFHCAAGISRSSTMAIAFLCAAKNYSLWQALNLCKQKRDIIKPNRGFMNSLIRMFV